MTYGFDQCMRCGTRIPIRKDSEKEGDTRLAKMTEAQWRAAGFLARPTLLQQRHPARGCCNDCAAKVFRQTWKPGKRLFLMWSAIAVFAVVVWRFLTLFMP